jgi:hypothetical protein
LERSVEEKRQIILTEKQKQTEELEKKRRDFSNEKKVRN